MQAGGEWDASTKAVVLEVRPRFVTADGRKLKRLRVRRQTYKASSNTDLLSFSSVCAVSLSVYIRMNAPAVQTCFDCVLGVLSLCTVHLHSVFSPCWTWMSPPT